jgi:polysaccharide export outer membrane protein
MKGTLRRVALSGLLAASVLALTTVAHAQTPSPEADGRGAPDAYRIGPEDQLLISVWKNDAMSRSVLVRPDGKIALPLLNDVQAAGLTALELRDVLTNKLKDFIPNPEVTVIVSDVRSLKVSVIGEVARPGRYELRSWATVLDALALAGGFTQYASRSKIVILHPKGKSMEKIPFNYNEVSGKQENFYLRNGDIVLVP